VTDVDGVLAGLRVIEVSSFVAAPLGGMTLAQLGADVIRVDPVGILLTNAVGRAFLSTRPCGGVGLT